MEILPVWTEEITVKPFETDFRGEWKPTSYFQGMQLAAAHHASNLGHDHHKLFKENKSWVLARMKIYFQRFPRLDERLIVRTWPRGFQQKIFFRRDFNIFDQAGNELATATSAWILIDIEKRRMLWPDSLNGSLPLNNEIPGVNENLERLPLPKTMQEIRTVRADYSAVDLMGHVNNTRYAEWVMDCFPFEHHRSHRLAWLQVNYNNEVRPEEEVRLSLGQDANDPACWYVAGAGLTPASPTGDGARAFEAALGWQPA